MHGILLMVKKKDGITELTKTLTLLATKIDRKSYDKLISVLFALLNGIHYGYTEMGTEFIRDANDIYDIHSKDKKKKKFKNNIISFKLIKGGKHDK